MPSPSRTLNNSFELEGKWFLPNTRKNNVYGSIRYSKDAIHLETIGDVERPSTADFISGIQSAQEQHIIPIIFGIATTGEKITLRNCVGVHRSSSWNNGNSMTQNRYLAIDMFIGKHFCSAENILFDSTYTEFSNFGAWYTKSGIKTGAKMDSQKTETVIGTMEYTPVKPTIVNIDDSHRLTIHIQESSDKSFLGRRFSVRECVLFSIKKTGLGHYRDFADVNQCFRYFLMLAMLDTVHPIRINGSSKGQSVQIYPGMRLYEKIPTNIDSDKMLFTFNDVEENFEEIIQSWWKLWNEYRDPICKYFSTILNQDLINNDLQFQSIALALESYHRLKCPDEEIPQEKYDVMIENMKYKLRDDPKQVGFIDRFKTMGNGQNLQKRLHNLIELAPETFADPQNEKSKFGYKVSNTRNYYAHGSKELKKKVVDPNKLFYLVQEMKLLMEGCLLKELPFSPDQLNMMMVKNRKIKNYARDHPLE